MQDEETILDALLFKQDGTWQAAENFTYEDGMFYEGKHYAKYGYRQYPFTLGLEHIEDDEAVNIQVYCQASIGDIPYGSPVKQPKYPYLVQLYIDECLVMQKIKRH